MQKNPSIVIINKLTKKQADFIKSSLELDIRATSLKLFSILYSLRFKETDKKIIFKKLFGQKYTDEKDYLLRNEFRILRQKLDDYLINLAIDDELKNNHFFRCKQRLFAYKHFGIDELFTEEYENTIQCAEKYLAFEEAISIQRWTMDKAYHYKLSNLHTYEDKAAFFKQLTDDCTLSLQKYNATIIRINSFFQSVSNHYKHLLGQADSTNIEYDHPEPLKIDDHELSLYYYYRTKGLANHGKDRVNCFIKSLEQINNYPTRNYYLNELALNTIINIGRSLQQSGDYTEALEYLTSGVTEYLPLTHNYPSTEKLYANYIVALLNTFEYEKAITILDNIEVSNYEEDYTHNWFSIYRIICLIGLKQTKELHSFIPINFTSIPPQHRIYIRLLQSIEYYLLNNIEDANRELYNLQKTISNKEHSTEIILIVDLYQAAFKLFIKCNKGNILISKEKHVIEKIIHQIDNLITEDINMIPLLLWLKRELIEKCLQTGDRIKE